MDRRAITQARESLQADAALTESAPAKKVADGSSFSFTLLVCHPSADLRGLTDALKQRPHRTWRKGDPITTPAGRTLSGTYEDSRWSCVWRFRRSRKIASTLSKVLDQITHAKNTLKQVRESGGKAQMIVRIAGFDHLGDTIDRDDLRRLSELGLDLGVEVFAEPQRS